MSLHDDYTRITPFEVAFPDRARLEALAATAAEEASSRGADATVLDEFVGLASVGAYLGELHGKDEPRVALLDYGRLVFQAVRFVAAGCPVFLLEAGAARRLVAAAPAGEPVLLAPAGYVQLPQHLFWTGAGADGAPESLDGMFWTATRAGTLHVLAIAGMRPDRPGFGTLTLPDAPLEHAREWMHASVRESGRDYASSLPGAALDELYGIEAAGELLKLLARFFAYAATTPVALEKRPPTRAATGPRPSALPYTRVKLAA